VQYDDFKHYNSNYSLSHLSPTLSVPSLMEKDRELTEFVVVVGGQATRGKEDRRAKEVREGDGLLCCSTDLSGLQ